MFIPCEGMARRRLCLSLGLILVCDTDCERELFECTAWYLNVQCNELDTGTRLMDAIRAMYAQAVTWTDISGLRRSLEAAEGCLPAPRLLIQRHMCTLSSCTSCL